MITRSDIDIILRSGDEESRRAVLEVLRSTSLSEMYEQLYYAMADSSWRVRKEAVEVFVDADPDDDQIGDLLEKLRDEDNAGLRNSAAEAIIRLGDLSAKALNNLTGDKDPDVRKFVIDMMGGIGSPQFMPFLLSSLADPDENVAAAAAEQLGNIGDNNAVSELLEKTNTINSMLFRFSALTALSKLNSHVRVPDGVIALADSDILRKAVFECLGSISDEASADILVNGFELEHKSCRRASVLSWYRIYNRTGPVGQLIMKDSLKLLYGRDVVIKIIEVFDTDNLSLAEAVTFVLGVIGDFRGTETLLSAYSCESLSSVAITAIRSLGDNGVKILISRYSDYDENMRCAACSLIAQLDYTDGRQVVHEALHDSSVIVKQAAIAAVGTLGMIGSINTLVLLLSNADPVIKSSVISCLMKLSSLDPHAILDVTNDLASSKSPETRRDSALLLSVCGGSETLFKLVKDEDAKVRLAAVTSIGKLKFINSCNVLNKALLDENFEVRIAAAEALVTVGCPDVLDSLFHVLKDDDVFVQCAVLKSIARVDMVSLFSAIKSLFPADDVLLTITCLELLEDIGTSEALDFVKSACENSNEDVSAFAFSILDRQCSGRTE